MLIMNNGHSSFNISTSRRVPAGGAQCYLVEHSKPVTCHPTTLHAHQLSSWAAASSRTHSGVCKPFRTPAHACTHHTNHRSLVTVRNCLHCTHTALMYMQLLGRLQASSTIRACRAAALQASSTQLGSSCTAAGCRSEAAPGFCTGGNCAVCTCIASSA